MHKNMYLLPLLLLSGTYTTHTLMIAPCGDIPVKRRYRVTNLFFALSDTKHLRSLLDEECSKVERIFPEAKPRVQRLIQDTDNQEWMRVVTNALPPSIPSVLITMIMDYKRAENDLDLYRLQEVIRGKGLIASAFRLMSDLTSRLFASDPADENQYCLTVESEEPRCSLSLVNDWNETPLTIVKRMIHTQTYHDSGPTDSIRECERLLEDHPKKLMAAYVQTCRQKAKER